MAFKGYKMDQEWLEKERKRLSRLTSKARRYLRTVLETGEGSPCAVRAAELVLRGCRVIEDGRVLDALEKAKERNAQVKRVVKIRYSSPVVKDARDDK